MSFNFNPSCGENGILRGQYTAADVSAPFQELWYWMCRTNWPLSFTRKDLNYCCHLNVEKWYKMEIHFYVTVIRYDKIKFVCVFSCSILHPCPVWLVPILQAAGSLASIIAYELVTITSLFIQCYEARSWFILIITGGWALMRAVTWLHGDGLSQAGAGSAGQNRNSTCCKVLFSFFNT